MRRHGIGRARKSLRPSSALIHRRADGVREVGGTRGNSRRNEDHLVSLRAPRVLSVSLPDPGLRAPHQAPLALVAPVDQDTNHKPTDTNLSHLVLDACMEERSVEHMRV
jgi:hypothetical protein